MQARVSLIGADKRTMINMLHPNAGNEFVELFGCTTNCLNRPGDVGLFRFSISAILPFS
jgi:hypothetical protein